MPGKQQAGCAACLRGKRKAPRDKRDLHLELAKRGNEGARFQALFECPGGFHRKARLHDEKLRRIKTEI